MGATRRWSEESLLRHPNITKPLGDSYLSVNYTREVLISPISFCFGWNVLELDVSGCDVLQIEIQKPKMFAKFRSFCGFDGIPFSLAKDIPSGNVASTPKDNPHILLIQTPVYTSEKLLAYSSQVW